MSLERRCDICDGHGDWELRKRWRLFKTIGYMDGFMEQEMDICDKCLEKFKVWVKGKPMTGGSGCQQ